MSKKSYCCHIEPPTASGRGRQCTNAAAWTITYGPSLDDYTKACDGHVGRMLVPDTANIVLPIEEG